MAEAKLQPRSALDDVVRARAVSGSTAQAGLRVCRRDGLCLATVMTRAGQQGALQARMRERFGLDLPDGPRRTRAGAMTAVGAGPGAWLIAIDAPEPKDFAGELARALGGVAAVTDQSGAYEVLRVGGHSLHDVLAKGVALDFHPDAFGLEAAAVTLADHVNVILWRVDDGDELTLDIAVPPSFFGSFWSWLTESAASVGLSTGDREYGNASIDRRAAILPLSRKFFE